MTLCGIYIYFVKLYCNKHIQIVVLLLHILIGQLLQMVINNHN